MDVRSASTRSPPAWYADVRYGRVYRVAFDAYCMQHPEDYGASARSYAAHLVGLCCGVERAGDAKAYRAIPHWLNGPKTIEKPDAPADRGRADRRGSCRP